jgi:hypothetical protein
LLTLVLLAEAAAVEVVEDTGNLEVLEVVQQVAVVQVETEQMEQLALTALVVQVTLEHLQLSEDLVQAEEVLLECLFKTEIVQVEQLTVALAELPRLVDK